MPTENRTVTSKFLGRISFADPNDLPPGAFVIQDNLECFYPGRLTARRGLSQQSTSGNIIAMYYYRVGGVDKLVWEDTSGNIKFANVSDLTTVSTIGSGYNASYPMCFAKGRNEVLYGVNGYDRGFRWDGNASAVDPLGVDAPVAGPTIAMAAGPGGTDTLTYHCAYRYVDKYGIPSSLSPDTVVTLAAPNLTFHWTVVVSGQTRCTDTGGKIQLWRTLGGAFQVYFLVAELTPATTTYNSDTLTDAVLETQDDLPDLAADLVHPNSRRFTPPPQTKPFICFLQDRLFFAGSGPLADSSERNQLYFCCDDKTETLTKRGWLTHDQLVDSDEVLTLNPRTRQIEWQQPRAINRFNFSGVLSHWFSSRFDAMTTDDHRWLAKGCGIMGGWHGYRSRDGHHFASTKTCNAMWSKRLIVSGGAMADREKVYSDEFVELAGWYMTEGTMIRKARKRQKLIAAHGPVRLEARVYQCSRHNPEYTERISKLAEHFGAGRCCPKKSTIHQFIFGLDVSKALEEACPGKRLEMEFLVQLTPNQLELLRDTMLCGDGHHHEGGTWIFSQNNMEMSAAFQALCAMTGKRTRTRIEKPITRDGKTFKSAHSTTVYADKLLAAVKLTKQHVYYNGVVWCPTTANSTWMARRNGTTYWTGNSEVDEPESVPSTNTVIIQENTGDDDDVTGMQPQGAGLILAKERHLYSVRFFRQPDIDVQPDLAARRGLVNNRCAIIFEGLTYWMDKSGIYRYAAGNEVEVLSLPIHDLFQPENSSNGTKLDFSKGQYFYATLDMLRETIRWYVALNGDTGTRVKRWIEIAIRTKAIWTGSSAQELGAGCLMPYGNQNRVVVGGVNGIFLTNEGLTDLLLDTTSANVSYQLRTGRYDLGEIRGPDDVVYKKRSIRIHYSPTNGSNTLNMTLFFNDEASARSFTQNQDLGTGFTTIAGTSIAALDMKAARSAQDPAQRGLDEFKIGAYGDEQAQGGDISVAINLAGNQSTDAITFYDLAVDGCN
jgi:hypothetical protein